MLSTLTHSVRGLRRDVYVAVPPHTRRVTVPDNVLRSYVQRWCHTVVRQAERISEQGFGMEREMDSQLFAFALRQFLRAVTLAAEETKSAEIDDALARFDGSFPHANEVRDQLTHFDAYERGIGRLQKGPDRGLEPMMPSDALLMPVTPYNQETAGHGWKVEIELGDYRLPIVDSARAARRLGDEVIYFMSTIP